MRESKKNSYEILLKLGEEELQKAGIQEAKLDAWYLFSHVTKMSRITYYLHCKEEVSEEIEAAYLDLLDRRKGRMPVAYLLESMEFMGLSFFVNEDVLIPNQDTEILVEEALKQSEGKEILDLCTGSGCIAISLALLGNPKFVTAVDISKSALEVARRNVLELLGKQEDMVTLIESDGFQKVDGRFDLIVSNPPYIPTDVIETLEPEVRVHEPKLALDGGQDGLDFYKWIVEEAPFYLRKGSHLLCEIGHDQGRKVSDLLTQRGFIEVKVVKDFSQNDRVVMGKWNE